MENFNWIEMKTYDKVAEFSPSERAQWENYIADEKSDWDEYEDKDEQNKSCNGYRIDTWSWKGQILKNIIAFPGDTPVGALFLNDDPYPIITESDGDLSNSEIENITELQQELQNNLKPWKHIQRTFEQPCSKNHVHCLSQYEKKLQFKN